MKKLLIVLALAFLVCGCGPTLDAVKKSDNQLATYCDKQEMTNQCRAGIAQADADVSGDPVNLSHVKAVTKYADENSEEYKDCYTCTGWLYFKGKKYEGAIRTWIKKLTEMGLIQ